MLDQWQKKVNKKLVYREIGLKVEPYLSQCRIAITRNALLQHVVMSVTASVFMSFE